MNAEDDDTQYECPVKGCEGGMVIARQGWFDGSYCIRTARCSYCGGTGHVTPERFAAYDGPRKARRR